MEKDRRSDEKDSLDADSNEDGSRPHNSMNGNGPTLKRVKISGDHGKSYDLTLNSEYLSDACMQTLKQQWIAKSTTEKTENSTAPSVYTDPFQICLLPELLQSQEQCRRLVDEMVNNVIWSRKQMDLYEFYQSTDLSNMSNCKMLTNFLQMLRRTVRPWLEKVTNMKLDYVSASCSMYTCGDYLLVHDDLLKDRQIAFVFYLSPWDGNEQWSEEQGGCLEIFGSDENCLPQFPIYRKISPKNNQFVFFKVGSRSFHQVGEVTNFSYPRLTINGWFHGATNKDTTSSVAPITKLVFLPPHTNPLDLSSFFNDSYLNTRTKQSIQKRIEDNSEISLNDFVKQDLFMAALNELRNDESLRWLRRGPANAHNYEILDIDSASPAVAQLVSLFSSADMFQLLRDYTDLDLAGPKAADPSYSLELQRWSCGNYTVLGDGLCSENTLDLIYYLNADDGAGVITYLSPEEDQLAAYSGGADEDDDSVLLTITPIDNTLNIVYRCENTTKFTKYVSRNTRLEKGPVFILSCSYKE